MDNSRVDNMDDIDRGVDIPDLKPTPPKEKEVKEGFDEIKRQNEELKNQVKNSWKNPIGIGIGFGIGIVAGVISSIIFGLLTTQPS